MASLANLKRKFIGDKAFYKMVMLLIIPMIVQQGITNFVNLLDNIMVGRLGTEPMSGVAITNQIIFIFNLTYMLVISHCLDKYEQKWSN